MDKANEIKERIYDEFMDLCRTGSADDLDAWISILHIDVNHDEGIFFSIAADRGDIEIIKVFIKHGANINDYVVYTCAYSKFYDCLEYLIECGANIESIKRTCGYKNAINFVNSKK